MIPGNRELTESWRKYKLSYTQGMELRRRCQTDLNFLVQLLSRKDKAVLQTAAVKEICDFFVVKNPDFPSIDAFCAAYEDFHDSLLLVPRGSFKSTVSVVDCVQWVICFPDISILIMTGVTDLASDFVGEMKSYFRLQDDGSPALMPDGTPSLFQILFPEHCFSGKGGNLDEWTSPARRDQTIKEPTVMSASIEQALSGWHFWLVVADDVCTNENTKTTARMATVIHTFDTNAGMLNPNGFTQKIGTWYDQADLWGRDIAREERAREAGEKPETKILLRGAAQLKPEFASDSLEDAIRNEQGDKVDLWFPERLTIRFLREKLKKTSWASFSSQYLNNPRLAKSAAFGRDQLLRATRPWNQVPREGLIVTAWDTAYSSKHWADYTVGLTGIIANGRVHVLDMVRGRFSEYELPAVIAASMFKWHPRRVAIEDSLGTRWLAREIRREMEKLRVQTSLEFISLGLGRKSTSKELKAKPVARLLGDGRLMLSATIPKIDDLYDELCAFPTGPHDDIVSALTHLCTYFVSAEQLQMAAIDAEVRADPKLQAHFEMIHGMGRYSMPGSGDPMAPRTGDPYSLLPNILGELPE